MRKFVLLILLLLTAILQLYADNDLEPWITLSGEWAPSWFGRNMTVLDFNADGIDDLIVSHGGNQDEYYGALNIYFGGDDFGNEPDMVIEGEYLGSLAYGVYYCGDVNGDGYDDFINHGLMNSDGIRPSREYEIRYYFGGPNPDLEVDQVFSYSDNDYDWYSIRSCLGDVNNDGYDDIALECHEPLEYEGFGYPLKILLGNTLELVEIIPAEESTLFFPNIEPMGDINNDGIADFSVGYGYEAHGTEHQHTRIFYGGEDFTTSFIDYKHYVNSEYMFKGAKTIGDFNGDGLNDFLFPVPNNASNDYYALAIRADEILESDELHVEQFYYDQPLLDASRPMSYTIDYGDFNGDGYSDFVGSNMEYASNSGAAGVWFGRATPNGDCDIRLLYPTVCHQFGYKVKVGDFDGDGLDDIAISSPHCAGSIEDGFNGQVYIYKGSTDLADTAVANSDQEVEENHGIRLNIYPNPSKSSMDIKYTIKGSLSRDISGTQLIIYNIKGQKIYSTSINSKDNTISIPQVPSGCYIAEIKENNKVLASSKFNLIK